MSDEKEKASLTPGFSVALDATELTRNLRAPFSDAHSLQRASDITLLIIRRPLGVHLFTAIPFRIRTQRSRAAVVARYAAEAMLNLPKPG